MKIVIIIIEARVLGRFKISNGVGRPWDSIFVIYYRVLLAGRRSNEIEDL